MDQAEGPGCWILGSSLLDSLPLTRIYASDQVKYVAVEINKKEKSPRSHQSFTSGPAATPALFEKKEKKKAIHKGGGGVVVVVMGRAGG